jgi:hypothetical protein
MADQRSAPPLEIYRSEQAKVGGLGKYGLLALYEKPEAGIRVAIPTVGFSDPVSGFSFKNKPRISQIHTDFSSSVTICAICGFIFFRFLPLHHPDSALTRMAIYA